MTRQLHVPTFVLVALLLVLWPSAIQSQSPSYGLEWPGDGAVRRMLYWNNPFPIYNATYIFKVYPRKKTSGTSRYYTTFFWGNNGTFWWDGGSPNTYYGAHPYPVQPPSGPGHWEIATGSGDTFVETEVEWNRWHTQAFRAWRESPSITHHEFYYDLPDTSKVITVTLNSATWAHTNPPVPAIVMGQAPDNGGGVSWGGYPGWEEFNGVIRGIKIYSGLLSLADIQSEIAAPMSTAAGQSLIWYLNLNPRPSDVTDKKGIGIAHNPSWDGATALEWADQGTPLDTTPPSAPTGLTATAVSSSQINLAWTASTDNIGVTGYRIFRDGTQVATVSGTSYQDGGLSPSTSHTYTVAAFDAQGNLSAPSSPATTTTLSAPPQPPGLLAAYGLGEGSGSSTYDASGNGHTGLLVGASWTSSGKYGSGVAFAGSTARVDLGTSADVPALPFTVEAWIYPTSRADWRAIISKRSSWAASSMRFDLGTEISSGRLYLAQPNSSLQSTYAPPLNSWTHIAVVADTAATRFYANGALVQTLGAFALGAGASAPLYIGNNGDLDDPFAGRIDEVRIYTRALTQAEIQADMNTPIGGSTPPPDTTPPATTITGGPSGTITVTSATFTWTGSDDVTPTSGLVYASRLDPLEAGFSAFGSATSRTYTNLANGAYTFYVKARDAAGNEDPTPASQSFTVSVVSVDTTPPTVAITTPTTAATYSTSSTPLTLGGTAADNVGVTQVTWANDRGGSGTAAGTTNWTASGIVLQSGTNILTVTARDAAGNTGSKTLTVSYTPPDTTPPTTTLLTGGASGTTTANSATLTITVNSITFNWTGSDNVTPAGSLVYAFRLDPLEPTFSAFSTATSKTYTGLANGSYTFYVKAKDQAGNEDPTPASQSLTVSVPDTTPPTVAITVPTPNPTYDTSSTPVTLGGTAADNVGVTQVTWVNDRGGSGTATGTTSWSASGIALKSGTNTLSVTARDAAGNTGTRTLIVKRHPKTSITGGPTGTITATSATFTWTDSYSDAQGVGFLYAYRLAPLEPSFSAFGRATSRTYTGLANSSYTFYVKAKDKWGNEDLVPTSQSFTVNTVSVDTTPPTVVITTPTTAATYSTSSSPLTLGGTAADNVGVTQVTWANAQGGSGTAAGTTSWTASGITLQSGANVLTVTARDAAGNMGSKTLTVTYTPGSHPPAATLIAPSRTTATATPTYTRNAVPTATSYQLWVNDSTGPKFPEWLGPATVGCAAGTGTCSFSPSKALAPGTRRWWIRTWNPGGHGPWSAPLDFTVL